MVNGSSCTGIGTQFDIHLRTERTTHVVRFSRKRGRRDDVDVWNIDV
jgi:hypothetical protein